MKTTLLFRSILLLVCLMGSVGAIAQVQDVRYYNKDMRPAEAADAHYLGAVKTFEAGSPAGSITFYTLDSVLVCHREYSNLGLGYDKSELHGLTTYWYPNGQKREQSNYENGLKHGSHQEWYENGNPKYSMNYYKSEVHGPLLGYYENGQLRRQDTYMKDKLIEGVLLTEDGKILPHVPYFQLPQYPGGEDNMFKFLAKTVKYPAQAQRKGKGGLVVLKLRIDTDGTVKDISVVQSVDPHLDNEAIRVAKLMTKWEVGTREGVAEAMDYFLPMRWAVR